MLSGTIEGWTGTVRNTAQWQPLFPAQSLSVPLMNLMVSLKSS